MRTVASRSTAWGNLAAMDARAMGLAGISHDCDALARLRLAIETERTDRETRSMSADVDEMTR